MKIESLVECNLCGSKDLKIIDAKICLSQCDNCEYIFDNPRPILSEISEFYSRPNQYDEWLSAIEDRDVLWQRRLDKLRKVSVEGTLLDVGSGIGQFLYHARPYYQKVFGTEVSESAINIAKSKYDIDLTQGSIEEIDFDGSQFNNITMFHVLEHVHNPKFVVQKCFDLLDKGGIFVVAVPNDINSFQSRLTILRYLKKWRKNASDNSGKKVPEYGKYGLSKILLDGNLSEVHLSHFTPNVLQNLLESSGFEVVENSLDQYYAVQNIVNHSWYSLHNILHSVTGKNYYDTIWIVGKK
jgi:2-polyprenyl-3-methyl-5-hydroxy-6-metoxy-1,4-benzoquinol methylase